MAEKLDEAAMATDPDNSVGAQEYILPRLAWKNQVAYFRVLFKVKNALDIYEQKF